MQNQHRSPSTPKKLKLSYQKLPVSPASKTSPEITAIKLASGMHTAKAVSHHLGDSSLAPALQALLGKHCTSTTGRMRAKWIMSSARSPIGPSPKRQRKGSEGQALPKALCMWSVLKKESILNSSLLPSKLRMFLTSESLLLLPGIAPVKWLRLMMPWQKVHDNFTEHAALSPCHCCTAVEHSGDAD